MDNDPKLVLVTWLDSYGCSTEWQSMKDIDAPLLTCTSVGWLIVDGEEAIVIVPHMSMPDHKHAEWQGMGDMTIPRTSVLSIENLEKRDAG